MHLAFDVAQEFLSTAPTEFELEQQGDSSYSIGGNFRAVTSGAIKFVRNWVKRGDYYMGDMVYPLALHVGNNLKGIKGLDLTKNLYYALIEQLEDSGLTVERKDADAMAIVYEGQERVLTLKYEYNTSFCQVLVVNNKK